MLGRLEALKVGNCCSIRGEQIAKSAIARRCILDAFINKRQVLEISKHKLAA